MPMEFAGFPHSDGRLFGFALIPRTADAPTAAGTEAEVPAAAPAAAARARRRGDQALA